MVAQRDAQHLFRLVLPDDEPIQIRLHLARFVAKLERRRPGFIFAAFRRPGRRRRRPREGPRPREMLLHKLRHPPLEFFRRRRPAKHWFAIRHHITPPGPFPAPGSQVSLIRFRRKTNPKPRRGSGRRQPPFTPPALPARGGVPTRHLDPQPARERPYQLP